jgi:hypothetical protein
MGPCEQVRLAASKQGNETMGALIIKQKMRTNKVSIRELAARLGMPMTKVRKALKYGVSGENALHDWLEAITR